MKSWMKEKTNREKNFPRLCYLYYECDKKKYIYTMEKFSKYIIPFLLMRKILVEIATIGNLESG